MKAVFMKKHGGPDVIEYSDLPTPEPSCGEVRVRLKVAALNRLDLWVREGWPGLQLTFPHIMGSDGTGKISMVGEGVNGIKPGDPVAIYANLSCGYCPYCQAGQENLCLKWHLLGETANGTYGEYVVVPARNVLPIPGGISYTTVAATSLVFLTAWHSLVSRGKLQSGESVLIIGASGGVNTASIQIAKFLGAKVIVIGSNHQKLTLAESLGADLLIDRRKDPHWSNTVYHATDRLGADVVVDNVGAKTMPESLRAVAKGGRILTVGNTSGPTFTIDNRFIFAKHLSILGSSVGTFSDFKEVMELIFAGHLRPVLDRKYPIADINAAMKRLESGKQMGKITLAIG